METKEEEKEPNLSKLLPWNSTENPLKVNSIRYNQDFSLLILGTSKGYKIFSTLTLKSLDEETDVIHNFDDIHIAESYYSSNIVLLLPSKFNKNYKNNEIIIFDDYFQKNIAIFKLKNDYIMNFYTTKNMIIIIAMNKLFILELYTLKIIDIIEDIAYNDKILSFNSTNNYIAYTKAIDRKTLYINLYNNDKHLISSKKEIKINTNFDFIQIFQFSSSGKSIVVTSIFGNKIHIYNTSDGKLKNCFFLGPKIQTLEKIFFSEKKPNYLLFIRNDKILNVYKLGKYKDKDKETNSKCICNLDNDQDLVSRLSEFEEKNPGVNKPTRKLSKNKNIKEPHVYTDFEVRLLFGVFDRNKHKDILLINKEGKLFKYHFDKKKGGKISPTISVQWI